MSERALRATDVPAAARLLACDPCWADRGERPSWVLDTVGGETDEHAAVGSFDGDELRAFASFNLIAGADGTGAISCVARADDSSGIAVLSAAVKELTSNGARLIVAEVPDIPEMGGYAELLTLGGFAAEADVADYFADGIGMRILVARPTQRSGSPS